MQYASKLLRSLEVAIACEHNFATAIRLFLFGSCLDHALFSFLLAQFSPVEQGNIFRVAPCPMPLPETTNDNMYSKTKRVQLQACPLKRNYGP